MLQVLRSALFTDGACTMQQFMWQLDITGVAYFVMDCLDVLDGIPSNQPYAAGTDVILPSFLIMGLSYGLCTTHWHAGWTP